MALDIVSKLLVKNPEQRLLIKEANRSQWYKANLNPTNKTNQRKITDSNFSWKKKIDKDGSGPQSLVQKIVWEM